jgi:hypothetical protein
MNIEDIITTTTELKIVKTETISITEITTRTTTERPSSMWNLLNI